jgi:6-phosphogluconolactonase
MSRIRFALAAALAALLGPAASGAEHWVYLGTFTGEGGSKGIYRCKFDDAKGKLSEPELAAEMASPSFLAVHPNGKYLYAVGEGAGKDGGPVVAFAIDNKTGALTKLNEHKSGGAVPVHVSIHPNGRYLIVANDIGAGTAVFRIADGKIAARTGFFQHEGDSVVKGRQDAPHPQCAFFDPTGKLAVTADLGLDKLKVFSFDADKGTITEEKAQTITITPGSGPRNFAYARDGEFLYVCGELNSTVNVVKFTATGGTTVQSISTLPEPMKGNAPAECLLSGNGKFVYVSNRGHNSVAVFTVAADGKLTAAGHITGDIKTPRGFRLDPSGRWMLIASQDGGKVGVWELDSATGGGKDTGHAVKVSKPVCVKFAPVEK